MTSLATAAAAGVPVQAEDWTDLALCQYTDPEVFFPEKGQATAPAKRICTRCPVTEQCLTYALAGDERHGIWGGLSERERRLLRLRRKDTHGHGNPGTDRAA